MHNRAMDAWRTGVVNADSTTIRIRGYDVTDLMRQAGFVETVFLLHRGRLPTPGERRLVDAILVGVADPGPGAPSCAAARLAASGNRQSVSAAIAAGVLAIGDEHGGAGETCMQLIEDRLADATTTGASVEDSARRTVEQAKRDRTRLPGLGHRSLTVDPRVAVLFDLAEEAGISGDGIRFVRALERAAGELIKPLPINIDGALAAVLHDLSFPPSAGKFIFIIGRVAGLTAEVAEEYAREKPMRVRIPVTYDGEAPRDLARDRQPASGQD
jgi:citrate synthase